MRRKQPEPSYLRLNLHFVGAQDASAAARQVRVRAEHWNAATAQRFEKSQLTTLEIRQLLHLETEPHDYGTLLGRAIFVDSGLVDFFLAAVRSAEPQPLHLILHLADEPTLGRLRWEWLCGPLSSGGQMVFLSRDSRTTLSLHIGTDVTYERRIQSDRLRSLVVSGCPQDVDPARFSPFVAKAASADVPNGCRVGVTRWMPFVNHRFYAEKKIVSTPQEPCEIWTQAVQELKQREPGKQYAVLHLICHGQQQAEGELGLLLTNPQGNLQLVGGEEVIEALSQMVADPGLPILLVLFVCESGHGPLSVGGFAQNLIERCGIPCVVAMRGPVEIQAASKVSRRLYKELAKHASAPVALARALRDVGTGEGELSITLYSRSAQQSLLDYTDEGTLTPKVVWTAILMLLLTALFYVGGSQWWASTRHQQLTDRYSPDAAAGLDQWNGHTKSWLRPKLKNSIANAKARVAIYQDSAASSPDELIGPVYQACVSALALARMGDREELQSMLSDYRHPTLRNQTLDLLPQWLGDRPKLLASLLETAAQMRQTLIEELAAQDGKLLFDERLDSVHLLQYSLLLAIDAKLRDDKHRDTSFAKDISELTIEGVPLPLWLRACGQLHFDPGVHAASRVLLQDLQAAGVAVQNAGTANPASLQFEIQYPRSDNAKLREKWNQYRQWIEYTVEPIDPGIGRPESVTAIYFPPVPQSSGFRMGGPDVSGGAIEAHTHCIQYGYLLCDAEMSINLFQSLLSVTLNEKRDLGFLPEPSSDCAFSPYIGRDPQWLVELQQCNNKLSQSSGIDPPFWTAEIATARPGYRYLSVHAGVDDNHTGFRLPTEPEWEYAARCHSREASFIGFHLALRPGQAGPVERFVSRRSVKQPVRMEKWPSPFGLLDIHGNLSEVCLGNADSSQPPGTKMDTVFCDTGPVALARHIGGNRLILRGGDHLTDVDYLTAWRRWLISGRPLADRVEHKNYGVRFCRSAGVADFEP